MLKGFRKGGSSVATSAAAAGSSKREGLVGGPSPQLQQLSEQSGLLEGAGARSDALV